MSITQFGSRLHRRVLPLIIAALFTACGDTTDPTELILTVEIDPNDTVVLIGGTAQLSASVTDPNGNSVSQAVSWSSPNTSIATVGASTGLVTGVAEGTVMITATAGDASAQATIAVTPEATFAADVQPILTANCATTGCHVAPDPQQGMDLSAGQAYAAIVNVASNESSLDRIEPGNPEASYLVHKIRGTQGSVGGSGGQMPLGRTPLPTATINVIRSWVRGGAQNN